MKLPKSWTTVTPLSKVLAMILFVGLPFTGFYIGYKYNQSLNPITTVNYPPYPSTSQKQSSPTPYQQNTQSKITAFLAKKYQKPISEVHVTVLKEVQGFASGSVLFGQGGPGEGGMWLAVLSNGWNVVWDGNGNVDCPKMRTTYGFPDTILKPNFCN